MFGEHPLDNENYGHIVNAKHFARVRGLIDPDKVVLGGTARESSLKIEPTILDGVAPEDAVMQEEIFGPILPVLTYESLDEAETFITDRPTPRPCISLAKTVRFSSALCVTCPLVVAVLMTPLCIWPRAIWALAAWERAVWGSTMDARASIRLATRRAS